MDAGISTELQLKQQLKITPQLQQAILFLQLPITDLLTKIQQYAEANPLLDVEIPEIGMNEFQTQSDSAEEELNLTNEEEIQTDFSEETDVVKAINSENNKSSYQEQDENAFEYLLEHYKVQESLRDHLLWQLQFEHLEEQKLQIAQTIIDAIDDDGFLRSPLGDIQKNLSVLEKVSIEQIEEVLKIIQHFDPSGIAARNLKECLLLQLEDMPQDTSSLMHAKLIIQNHLPILAKHDYRTLKQKMNIKENELLAALHLIKSLNPMPGYTLNRDNSSFEIPDVIVKRHENSWEISLNEEVLPKIKINQHYSNLLNNDDVRNAAYLRRNLQEANWLIKSLSKRNETLLKVSQYIVETQNEFLQNGPMYLKPLGIRDVADALKIHESTVSRITSNKFILSPQGIHELKYFFTSHLARNNAQTTISSIAVKSLIKKIIHQENPEAPYTDEAMVDKLKQFGVSIARRTVAKYREALNIPSCDKRKFIC